MLTVVVVLAVGLLQCGGVFNLLRQAQGYGHRTEHRQYHGQYGQQLVGLGVVFLHHFLMHTDTS